MKYNSGKIKIKSISKTFCPIRQKVLSNHTNRKSICEVSQTEVNFESYKLYSLVEVGVVAGFPWVGLQRDH